VVDTNIDPASIAGKVIDPVRDRLLHLRAAEEEAVVLHLDGFTPRAPLPPDHWQPAQLFPLLGVHADHGLPVGLVLLDLSIDVAKLGISIGVLGSLQRFDVRLQAKACRPKQPPHGGSRHQVPLPGQFFSQMTERFRRPPQWGLRVASLVRLDQPEQRAQHRRVMCLSAPTTAAWCADATVSQWHDTDC
jgi:hypothetical protein